MAVDLQPGTLWPRVLERHERALQRGALTPIETRLEHVEDEGVRFAVRAVSNVARKQDTERAAEAAGRARNPFLDYDPDLFVADVSDRYVCLFNKFNVFDHHLLVVTRQYEDQQALLTERDFEALCACMDEFDALAFYNAGAVAGASQPHKHMQLVPVPLDEGPGRTPMDRVLATGSLPFVHAVASYEPTPGPAHARYLELLTQVGCDRPPAPYNLLATREWMWVVPRTRQRFDGIDVNALGFAGSLLVRDRAQLEQVRRVGPMGVIRQVSSSRRG